MSVLPVCWPLRDHSVSAWRSSQTSLAIEGRRVGDHLEALALEQRGRDRGVGAGEHDRARTLCEKLLSYSSPLGLYAEEIDQGSGRHLGNFPQAFTHLALINAVMHVVRADQQLATTQPLLEARRREVPAP